MYARSLPFFSPVGLYTQKKDNIHVKCNLRKYLYIYSSKLSCAEAAYNFDKNFLNSIFNTDRSDNNFQCCHNNMVCHILCVQVHLLCIDIYIYINIYM